MTEQEAARNVPLLGEGLAREIGGLTIRRSAGGTPDREEEGCQVVDELVAADGAATAVESVVTATQEPGIGTILFTTGSGVTTPDDIARELWTRHVRRDEPVTVMRL